MRASHKEVTESRSVAVLRWWHIRRTLFIGSSVLPFVPNLAFSFTLSLAVYVIRHMPTGPEKLSKIRRMGDVDDPERC